MKKTKIKLNGYDKIDKEIDLVVIKNRLTMMYAPPGRGKTYSIIKRFAKNYNKVYFLVPELSLALDLVKSSYYKEEICESYISNKHKKYNNNGNVVVCNYDQFKKIKIEQDSVIVIDEADSIIRDDFREVMKDMRDLIVSDKHNILLMTGTGLSLKGWLQAYENHFGVEIDYYSFILEDNVKDICYLHYGQSPKIEIIKVMKHLLLKKDSKIGIYLNNKNDLLDISNILEEMKINHKMIHAKSNSRNFNFFKDFNKDDDRYVFLFTKSVERGVSALNKMNYMIAPINLKHSLEASIQATDRERNNKVKKIFIYSPTTNGLKRIFGKEMDLNMTFEEMNNELVKRIDEKLETDLVLSKLKNEKIFTKYDYYSNIHNYYYLLNATNLEEGFKKHQMILLNKFSKYVSFSFPEMLNIDVEKKKKEKRYEKDLDIILTYYKEFDFSNVVIDKYDNMKDLDLLTNFNEEHNNLIQLSLPKIMKYIKQTGKKTISVDEYEALMKTRDLILELFYERKDINVSGEYHKYSEINNEIWKHFEDCKDFLEKMDIKHYRDLFINIKKNGKKNKYIII